MSRPKVRATLAIALLFAPLVLLAAACSRPPENQLLIQFFRAARARDNTTLAMMSAVPFDPREQGTVDGFEITSMGEERRTRLDFKSLLSAQQKATEADAEFKKRKIEYQNANLPALEVIVKLEKDPNAKMTPAQLKMKAEWDKWREDTTFHTKAVTAARDAFKNSTGPAEASLTQPGQPPFDAAQFEGELVSKDVAITANLTPPNGTAAQKPLTITFQKVVGTQAGQQREGRWIITGIKGV